LLLCGEHGTVLMAEVERVNTLYATTGMPN
jgi:hypothetical protein